MTDKATVTVDLEQLRALEAAATAEPWEADVFAVVVVHGASTVNVASQILDADAALIVFLRNNAAAMADEIETLEARLAEAEADAALARPLIAAYAETRDAALVGDDVPCRNWVKFYDARLASRPEGSS